MENNARDWTEPEYLGKSDWAVLKEIKRLHGEGNMQEAMSLANTSDTIVREEIPPQVWLDMGGTLTPTGLERLRLNKKENEGRTKE